MKDGPFEIRNYPSLLPWVCRSQLTRHTPAAKYTTRKTASASTTTKTTMMQGLVFAVGGHESCAD